MENGDWKLACPSQKGEEDNNEGQTRQDAHNYCYGLSNIIV